jgi:hypothetical protein|tara:strand:+ start:630 stop:872 length:243 start_codon:yes stop_codon:yes gene_type:complete
MPDDELKKKSNSLNSIDVGDMVESATTGRIGVVKSIVWEDGEPYVYGPYIIVVWVVRGYESCWIPHYDFKIISKASKNSG